MSETLGIIAGRGNFPVVCAQAAKKDSDDKVIALAIRGFAHSDLERHVDEIHWFELGQVGKLIKTCKSRGIQRITLAGKIEHVNLLHFQRFDTRALKILYKLPDKRAQTVLRAIIDEFATEGIQVMDSAHFLRSTLAKPGLLTPQRKLSKSDEKDVAFAYPLAKQIAELDIGQTIIVKNQIIVAVEGLEGTDACIQRAAEYVGGGFVVVKVSRPSQDFRFDLPVIGLDTIKVLQATGASCLAISAEETLFFCQEEAIELAHSANIGILAT